MPEIRGTIVFKAQTEAIANCLHKFSEAAPTSIVANLIEATGLKREQTNLYLEDGSLASDSVEHVGRLTVIEPLGDEWIKMLEVLQHAKGLEYWAHIHHENGVEYFIASVGTQALSNAIDLEEGDLEDEEIDEIEQNWLATVPVNVRAYFAEELDME